MAFNSRLAEIARRIHEINTVDIPAIVAKEDIINTLMAQYTSQAFDSISSNNNATGTATTVSDSFKVNFSIGGQSIAGSNIESLVSSVTSAITAVYDAISAALASGLAKLSGKKQALLAEIASLEAERDAIYEEMRRQEEENNNNANGDDDNDSSSSSTSSSNSTSKNGGTYGNIPMAY